MTPRYKSAVAVILMMLAVSCTRESRDNSETEPAYFDSITETGELQAVNSTLITVPFYGWEYGRAKLIWLEDEGTQVQAGDVVALLDTSGVKSVKAQKIADLQIAVADLEKLKVEQAANMQQLEADLQSAEAALQLANIEMQRVQYESEAQKEITQYKLEIAQTELNRLETKLDQTRIIDAEAVLIQKAKVRQVRSSIDKANRAIEKFTIKAPSSGIVEHYRNRRSRNKIAVGEEFWPGDRLIGLPDLSKMKVQTSVVETDIAKVERGQAVVVRLDAYPKMRFEGKIDYVGITCYEKDHDSKIKIFDVEVLIDEQNPILRPGMTVSCEIFLQRT